MTHDKAKLLTELQQFQAEMLTKLLKKYDEGYKWWDDPAEIPDDKLVQMAMGNEDPIDRANFNFFLWFRNK